MKNHYRHIKSFSMLMLSAGMALLASCEDDYFKKEAPEIESEYSDEITFGMTEAGDWNMSRSAVEDSVPDTSFVLADPIEVGTHPSGKPIMMSVVVSDMAEPAAQSVDMSDYLTRAIAIDEKDELDFGIYSYLRKWESASNPFPDEYLQFMHNTRVDISDGYSYSPKKFWPGSTDEYAPANYIRYGVVFWGYRPYIDVVNPEGKQYLVLDYQFGGGTTAPSAPTLTYTVPNLASEHHDLMAAAPIYDANDANYGHEFPGNYRQKINFPFRHLLSEVKFSVGSMPKTLVSNITLSGVKNKGTATMTDAAMTAQGDNDGQSIQTLNPPMDADLNPNSEIGTPFYMMPQTLTGTDAQVSVTLNYKGDTGDRTNKYTINRKLDEFTAEWIAGKSYTYRISTPEEVDIAVTDEVSGNVKKNLKVTNNGISPIFVRVAVAGSWVLPNVDEENRYDVVAGWEVAGRVFKRGGASMETLASNDDWYLGADGYYYYMKILFAGETAVPLFDSFELNVAPPVADAQLEVNILAQGVRDYDMKLVGEGVGGWDSGAIAKLKEKYPTQFQ